MNGKILGIIIIVVALLGLSSSLVAYFLQQESQGIAFYVFNTVGDITVIIGGIALVMRKSLGKLFVYIGSILFGIAGVLSMSYSIIGGLITVIIAVLFIILTRFSRLDHKN